MGSFYTNIQVYTGGSDPGGVRGQVVEALRRYVLAGPYEEVAEPRDADRVIAIGPAGEYPWVTIARCFLGIVPEENEAGGFVVGLKVSVTSGTESGE